jgi:ABC-type uncharacterized transport system permease subunit
MPPILLYVAATILYAALAFHFWRTRWHEHGPASIEAWERWAIMAPLAIHGWLVYEAVLRAPELRFGFGMALSIMLWLTVLLYWIESLFFRLEGMQPLVLGVAAACVPLPLIFPGLAVHAPTGSFEFRLHLMLGMSAYSLFTIAALHALLMTLLERRLHGGALSAPFSALPPLLTMESLLFRIIFAGFILLTLTLATGFLFSEDLFGRPLRFEHKSVFAIASWVIFAALLAGRRLYGWRGRAALRWTLAGFLTLLLAYVGSRFVLEVILGRGGV